MKPRNDYGRMILRPLDTLLCFWCYQEYGLREGNSRCDSHGACMQRTTGRYFCCVTCWERYLEVQRANERRARG